MQRAYPSDLMSIPPITISIVRTQSGRYDLRYPDGVEPSTPDITISTVPNFELTAGTSFSQNFNAYASGADLSGATYSLVRVSGDTLTTLDLTFSTSTLSGATPDVGSGVYYLRIDKSGFPFLSNTFSIVVNPAVVTDTQAPTEVFGLRAVNFSTTRNDLTIDWPSDVRTPTIGPTDNVKIVIERQIDGGAFSALTTLTASGPQPNPPLTFTGIGTTTASGSQNGPDLSMTIADGLVSSTVDSMGFYGGLVSGSFEVSGKMPDISSGYSWSTAGPCCRQNRDPLCPAVIVTERTNTNTAGAPCLFRSQQGGALTYTPDAQVPSGTPYKLIRNATTHLWTYQVWDATGQNWLTIGSGTVVMQDPIEVGVHVARSAAGAAITVLQPQFRVNKLGQATHQDTTVTAGHTYGYRAKARDAAVPANDSAFGPTSLATTPTPSNQLRFDPGYYCTFINIMEDSNAATIIPQWITWINELANEPTVAGVKVFIRWRAVEGNTAGDYTTGLARLRQIRDACAAVNKKLWVSFLHVIFGGTSSDWTLYFPGYIVNSVGGTYGISVMTNGKIARVWQEATMTRVIAQCNAFANADNGHGTAFKNDPTIAMMQIDETGIGMAIGVDGFQYAAVVTQYNRWMIECRANAPNLPLKLTANYLGSDDHIWQMINVAVQQKCAIGGPDILPKEGIQANRIFTGTPPSESGGSQTNPVIDRRGVVPFSAEVQLPSIGGHEGNWTMEELVGSTINGYPYTSGGIARFARATQPSYIPVARQTSSAVGINWNSPRVSDGAESILSYIRRTNGAVARPNYPSGY